jgi:hypothetical protein
LNISKLVGLSIFLTGNSYGNLDSIYFAILSPSSSGDYPALSELVLGCTDNNVSKNSFTFFCWKVIFAFRCKP